MILKLLSPSHVATAYGESRISPGRVAAWGLDLVLALLLLGSAIEALYPTPRSPDVNRENVG